MRTKNSGMGAGSDPAEDDETYRDEGYTADTDEGRKFVIFDPKNPLAWITSDWYGTPPDAADGDDAVDGEEPTE